MFKLWIKQSSVRVSCGSVLFCVEFKDDFEIMEKVGGGKKLLTIRESFPEKNIRNVYGN